MNIIKPKRLRHGDLIGLVTPASPIADPPRIERAVHYLERLGYRVTVGERVGKVHGYLAGADEERLADLRAMFEDQRVKAIIALRGGYGTPRLLSKLNYRLISRNPKILVGFSDITALQLALWRQCGLITFHGPMAGVDMADTIDGFTEELFWRTVTSTKKIGRISFPPGVQPSTLHPGKAVGRLVGGNLSIVVSLLGTHYFPRTTDAVLFLEDIGEEPYRVDRMMTQLRNAKVFSKCNAVLTGQFSDCLPKDQAKPSLSVEEILDEVARHAGRPFISNLPFAHLPQKMTLPIGLRVQVDASSASIQYLESAVS
ncbi:MAG TPA: LD-carboxypeptidase [Bacteroidetes bacterium]|nr:LD-carboxypeptidase [Bacteroidota bacterium]